jgi:hypothetical protein
MEPNPSSDKEKKEEGEASPKDEQAHPTEQPVPPRPAAEEAKPEAAPAEKPPAEKAKPPQTDADEQEKLLNAANIADVKAKLKADFGNTDSSYDKMYQRARIAIQRERIVYHGWLGRYERGLEILFTQHIDRQRMQKVLSDEDYTFFLTLRSRLIDNINLTRLEGDSENRRSERNSINSSLEKKTLEILQLSFTRDMCDVIEESSTASEPKALPTTLVLTREWFTDLRLQEQCFVVAMAMLYGASAEDITLVAKEFYAEALADLKKQRKALGGEEPLAEEITKVVPLDKLLHNTFCVADIAVSKEGVRVERIYWRDDALVPLVFEVLADYMLSPGITYKGRTPIQIAQQWVDESEDEDRVWRATRFLGGIWGRRNQAKLLAVAREWSQADDTATASAATLLYSAVEITYEQNPQHATAILDEIHRWSDWKRDENLGAIAFGIYGLLGDRWPEIAIPALLDRLGLPETTEVETPPPFALVLGMFSLVAIASDGRLGNVVHTLADRGRRVVNRRFTGANAGENVRLRRERQQQLDIATFIFLFIGASASTSSPTVVYDPSEGLPEYIEMTSEHDPILQALISTKPVQTVQQMRSDVMTLLGIAALSGKPRVAFNFLETWAQALSNSPAARETFAQFVVRF